MCHNIFQDIIDDKRVNRLKDVLIENFASSNETVNEVEEPGICDTLALGIIFLCISYFCECELRILLALTMKNFQLFGSSYV